MNNGVFSASHGLYSVSTPMTEKKIDTAVEAFEAATLGATTPNAVQALPRLIADQDCQR